jgi:plastocyanin
MSVLARRSSAVLAAVLTAAVPAPVAAALALPAHPGQKLARSSQGKDPAATPGHGLELVAIPVAPTAGQPVRVRVVGAPDGARFIWDLPGAASYKRHSGQVPGTIVRFLTPGPRRVAVRVAGSAQTKVVSLELMVRRRASDPGEDVARPGVLARRRVPASRGLIRAQVDRGDADPAASIADFNFSPATITIHVGDTVTWTNDGPSPHTATARDGSFDTGVLQKGQSASHTFTQSGTFAFFCTIHPFMHGTLVVQAAATSAPQSSSAGTTTAPPSGNAGTTTAPPSGNAGTTTAPPSGNAGTSSGSATSPPASSAGSASALPTTGIDVLAVAVLGLLLSVAGSLGRVLAR